MTIRIDTREILDWETFHTVFAKACNFPDFYGRNLNAWIDCMGDLDGMCGLDTQGKTVMLELQHVDDLVQRRPDIYQDIVECTAFVNWRTGQPLLALSFSKSP